MFKQFIPNQQQNGQSIRSLDKKSYMWYLMTICYFPAQFFIWIDLLNTQVKYQKWNREISVSFSSKPTIAVLSYTIGWKKKYLIRLEAREKSLLILEYANHELSYVLFFRKKIIVVAY